jgi:hypothetical protein
VPATTYQSVFGGNTIVQGGAVGGYGTGYSPTTTVVTDLQALRQQQQAREQQELIRQQNEERQRDRAFQAQEAALGRAQQLGLQTGQQAFQSQQRQAETDAAFRLQGQAQAADLARQNSQQSFTSGENAANRGFQASESAADRAFRGAQADADRYFQGTQADLQRQFQGGQNDADRAQGLSLANISAETQRRGQDIGLQQARLPFEYRDRVLAQFDPQLRGAFDRFTNGGDISAYLSQVGGNAPPSVALPSATVFDPNQVQQQVNAARAQGDAQAGDEIGRQQAQFAGRGFGLRGPALAALEAQIRTGAAASNADQERQIRLDAAQANATQGVRVGQLANEQYRDVSDADIRRRTLALGARNDDAQNQLSLIASILGIV